MATNPVYPSAPTVQPVVAVNFKSITVMWVLWLFLGGFSAHLFYVGKTTQALVRLFTLQYLLVG